MTPPAPPDPERRDDAREETPWDGFRWGRLFEGMSPPLIVLAILLYGFVALVVVSVVFAVAGGLKALSVSF